MLKDGTLEEELRELEEENEVFREFLRSRGEEPEDSGSEPRSGAEEGEVIGNGDATENL